MSFKKLIIPALSTLLEDGPIANILVEKAAEKDQKSYGYALAAISVGLAMPEQKLGFIKKFFNPQTCIRI